MADAPGSTTNLSDTSTWLPLDGLAPGFDANKAEPTSDLDGRTITLIGEVGATTYRFENGQLGWHGAASGSGPVEVFEVDQDLYYAQVHVSERPDEAVSLILDLRNGHALSVVSTIGRAVPGRTAVQQSFTVTRIDAQQATGETPAPSTELIGRRAMWVYSTVHAYEHVYLSPHWYSWQCLAGPERGLADTDECTVWRMRPGIYVFAWREKVIPCGSVTIADHRDQHALRSHGYLFGTDEAGTGTTHFTFGAHGRLLSNTVHPAEYDPALTNDRA